MHILPFLVFVFFVQGSLFSSHVEMDPFRKTTAIFLGEKNDSIILESNGFEYGNLTKCVSFDGKIVAVHGRFLDVIYNDKIVRHDIQNCVALDYRYVYTYNEGRIQIFNVNTMEVICKIDINLMIDVRYLKSWRYSNFPMALIGDDLYFKVNEDGKMFKMDIRTKKIDKFIFSYEDIFPDRDGYIVKLKDNVFIFCKNNGTVFYVVFKTSLDFFVECFLNYDKNTYYFSFYSGSIKSCFYQDAFRFNIVSKKPEKMRTLKCQYPYRYELFEDDNAK